MFNNSFVPYLCHCTTIPRYQISFSFLTVYLHTVSAMAIGQAVYLSQKEFLHNSIVNVGEPSRMTLVYCSPTL